MHGQVERCRVEKKNTALLFSAVFSFHMKNTNMSVMYALCSISKLILYVQIHEAVFNFINLIFVLKRQIICLVLFDLG